MTWTTARPTQAGWYWYRECCPEDERPVRVQINARGTFVQPSWGDHLMEIDEFLGDGDWLGPIAPEDCLTVKAKSCAWKYDCVDDYYDTACGNAYCLSDGSLADNDHRYCPFCGGLIDDQTEDGEIS